MERYPLEETNKIIHKENPIPFMLLTNEGKPLTVIAENQEGYYFSSQYFIIKNKLIEGSCIELIPLEAVGTDGCVVEYPECFYSLQTTRSCIFVSTKSFCNIQTFSSKFINRKLIDPCPKDC